MATENERKFLGLDGTEQLVATVKSLINNVNEVPASTTLQEGMFLRVVNGKATWTNVPSAEEANF